MCSESARPIAYVACSEVARPTASVACPESARPTAPTVIVPASAQVGLADSQSAKPTLSVPAVANASSGDSAPIVGDEEQHHSNQGRALL